jgi:protein arginine kinase activator
MICEKCKKQTATVHLTDLVKGEKRERHLCEDCAGDEGVTVKQHVNIHEVINTFLGTQAKVQEITKIRCPQCGISFVEFRNQGLLGCPHDYDVFGEAIGTVIERSQDGHTHHTGKTPGEAPRADPARQERLRIQRDLREAVEREDYEKAARLRDDLERLSS